MFIKLYPTAQGAITQLYAGTAPEGKDLNGKVTALYSLHGQINAMNRLINCYLDFFTLVSDPVGSSGRTPERGLRRRTEQKIMGICRRTGLKLLLTVMVCQSYSCRNKTYARIPNF